MDIYAYLRDNKSWCASFVERYAQLLSTSFSVESLENLLDEMAAERRPEMAAHIALYHAPESMEAWEGYLASMKTEIEKRYTIIQKQIISEFGLEKSEWNALMEKYGGQPLE